jgi:sterol 3beta-glucosyltransferase
VPGLLKRSLGPLNRATYRLSTAAARTFRGTVDAWREEVLDLPHAPHGVRDVAPDGSPLPKLYAYSEAVLPRPADWGDDTIVSGYWDLEPAPGWTADAGLRRFLAAGPAPVYVGFGSMPLEDPEATAAEVVAALRSLGLRGLLGGALAAGARGDDMLALADVPHSWLFEHVAAVVHPGGAGPPGAGRRAGRPTVIVPHAVDQPFWARAVHARGASPRPLAPDRLDARHLSAALAAALADPIAGRASDLGRALRREHGVATAVHHLSTAIHPSDRRNTHVHAI